MYNPDANFAKVAKCSKRGSRPGERRGGRSKGTRNKQTLAQMALAELTGLTPLERWLSVIRAETLPLAQRMAAAIEAMPYMHAKLKQIDLSGKDNAPLGDNVSWFSHDPACGDWLCNYRRN